MALAASSLVSKLNLRVKIDNSFMTVGKIIICLACNKSWVFNEISCTKRATKNKQLSSSKKQVLLTKIFDLKKQIFQGYVQWDCVL
jgi:hypothetical protein